MRIKSKYNIGDRVLLPADKKISVICPFCGGEGEKVVDGVTLYCHNCDGDGKITTRSDDVVYVEGFIDEIRIHILPTEKLEEYDDDYVPLENDSPLSWLIEYYTHLADEEHYYGFGTNKESSIKPFEEK